MFMDVHDGLGDATPEEVDEAHRKDLAVQDEFGVRWVSYWLNGPDGKSFCLAEAPDAESLRACHKASHGLMPHDVIEIPDRTLAMFMGAMPTDDGDRVVLELVAVADLVVLGSETGAPERLAPLPAR